MLALPVLTSPAGFFPSLSVFLVCWIFMLCTGLLFLEVCLWMQGETNIISMARRTLGFTGQVAAWILYLLLFYCLTVAYIVGCGNLVSEMSYGMISDRLGPLVFVLLFSPVVFAGVRLIGRLNMWFMGGLALLYVIFVGLGYRYVNTSLLFHADWSRTFFTLPIVFTAFAYQGIVPSLTSYMNRDVKKIRLCIVIGTFIPLVTYFIWQWLIMGIVPAEGPGGLEEALARGDNAVNPLKNFLENPSVYLVGRYFAFFALATSFLGVSVGLLDFLADGFKIEKNGYGRFIICLMIFIPTLLIAVSFPHIFLNALEYAGGFGCALLLGLLPILMVWSGRYYLGYQSETSLPGGRFVLGILAAFVVLEIGFETVVAFL